MNHNVHNQKWSPNKILLKYLAESASLGCRKLISPISYGAETDAQASSQGLGQPGSSFPAPGFPSAALLAFWHPTFEAVWSRVDIYFLLLSQLLLKAYSRPVLIVLSGERGHLKYSPSLKKKRKKKTRNKTVLFIFNVGLRKLRC